MSIFSQSDDYGCPWCHMGNNCECTPEYIEERKARRAQQEKELFEKMRIDKKIERVVEHGTPFTQSYRTRIQEFARWYNARHPETEE